MRDAVRSLIEELLRAIVIEEGVARECAEIAHTCREEGGHEIAGGIQSLARHHRVRAMEARARVAALKATYRDLDGEV